MKITGNAVLNAPADRVWAALNDPGVLARTIPGCERLEETGPDRYALTITAGVASVKGTYQGDVALADPVPPESFTLRASGAGVPGSVRAEVRITLQSEDGVRTTVAYDADAVVGGAVGGVGQRVVVAVAKRTASQFFSAIDDVLAGRGQEAPDVEVAGVGATGASEVAARTWQGSSAAQRVPAGGARSEVPSVLLGACVALAGVVVGWAVGRRR